MAKKGSYVYLWCEISNAFLSSTVQLFYNLLERPVFVVCFFFSAIKKRLIEICLSLTWFLHIINLIG